MGWWVTFRVGSAPSKEGRLSACRTSSKGAIKVPGTKVLILRLIFHPRHAWHRHPSSMQSPTPASANASRVAEWQVKKMIWRPAAKSAMTRAAAGRR